MNWPLFIACIWKVFAAYAVTHLAVWAEKAGMPPKAFWACVIWLLLPIILNALVVTLALILLILENW